MPIRGLTFRFLLPIAATVAARALPADDPAGPPSPPIPLGPGEEVGSESITIERDGRLAYAASVLVPAGFVGVEVRPVDRDTAGRMGLAPFEGVLAVSVERDGPAARAGLVREDVILIVGAQPVRSAGGFEEIIQGTPPGSTVFLGILRDGVRGDLPVIVGTRRRPSERLLEWRLPLVDDRTRTGLLLAEATPEVGPALERTAGAGAGLLVADLLPGGPAFRAGILPGDLIVEVGPPGAASRGAVKDSLLSLRTEDESRLVVLRKKARLERSLAPSRDATVIRECRGPLSVVSWKRSAAESRTSIFWGLFYRRSEVCTLGGPRAAEPAVEKRWAAVFDFLGYHEKGGRGTLRVFWVIPIGL